MDSEWEKLEYDGSFYFNSDRIIELRDEYLKDEKIVMPIEPLVTTTWPLVNETLDLLESFLQSILLITFGSTEQNFDIVRQHVYMAPFVGSCYQILLEKCIQTLAFKQTDHAKNRCWRLLQTLCQNPYCKKIPCKEEYFHLAEILVCQLLGRYADIPVVVKDEPLLNEDDVKLSNPPMDVDAQMPEAGLGIKVEDIKEDDNEHFAQGGIDFKYQRLGENTKPKDYMSIDDDFPRVEKRFRLEKGDDDEDATNEMEGDEYSPYSADKTDDTLVDELCRTIGLIAATDEYFYRECMFLILKRLEKFSQKRHAISRPDFDFISRTFRGLTALGEYAYRHFIPYLDKIDVVQPSGIPYLLIGEFARSAIFLGGSDDAAVYEWLYELCGDMIIPFISYSVDFHQKLMKKIYLKRRAPKFRIVPKVVPRRLSAFIGPKKEPVVLNDIFPGHKLVTHKQPAFNFKYKDPRPVPAQEIMKTDKKINDSQKKPETKQSQYSRDVIIARRKLFKPLSDEKRYVRLSSFHMLKI